MEAALLMKMKMRQCTGWWHTGRPSAGHPPKGWETFVALQQNRLKKEASVAR
jgi:hypothetical protein